MLRFKPQGVAVVALVLATAVASSAAVAKQLVYSGKGPVSKSQPLPQDGPIPPKVTGRPEPGVGWALRLGCMYGQVGKETTYSLDALGIASPGFRIEGWDGYDYDLSTDNTLLAASGITFDPDTGTLSGTPKSAIAGVFTYDVFSPDGEDYARSRACFQFTQSPDTPDTGLVYPRLLPPEGDDPTVVQTGQYFEVNFSQVYGFYGNVSYSIDPKPPKGLTFVNGILAGQLADTQVYKFTVKAVDSRDGYGTMPWSVNVTYPQPLSPKSLDDNCVTGTVGDVVDRQTFGVDVPDDQYADVSFKMVSGPPGVSMYSGNGQLSGTLQPFLDGDNFQEWTKPIEVDVYIGTETGATTYSMSLCTDIKAKPGSTRPDRDDSTKLGKATVSAGAGGSYLTGQQIKVPVPTTSGFVGTPYFTYLPGPPPGLNQWPDGHLSGALAYAADYSYEVVASDGQNYAISPRATITVAEKPEGSVVYDGTFVLADTVEELYEFNPFVVSNLPSNARWSIFGDIPPQASHALDPSGKPYPGAKILATTGDMAMDLGYVVRGSQYDDPARYCTCDANATVRYYPTVRVTWTEQDGSYREIDNTIPVMLKIVDFRPTQP